jgi:hypothetical protein
MNLVSADRPKKELYAFLKSATSNCLVLVQKVSLVPKVMWSEIRPTGVAAAPGTMPSKGSRQPHLIKSLQKKVVEGAACMHEQSAELNVLYDGADYRGMPPWLWYKVQVVTAIKGNGDLRPS